MTRSWVTFTFGVLLLASPLRLLWARAGAPAWGVFVAWAALIAAAAWVLREGKR